MPASIVTRLGSDTITQTLKKLDMSKDILVLKPEKYPLTVLLNEMKKQVSAAVMFEWHEEVLTPRWDRSMEAVNAVATDFQVDNVTYFRISDLIMNPRTGERMRVTALNTPAAGDITIVRGVGSTAAPILVGDAICIIGSAYAESAAASEVRMVTADHAFNYVQIFKNSASATGTEGSIQTYGNDNLARRTAQKAEEHLCDIERTLFFGSRSVTTGGGTPFVHERRTTGGVDYFISTAGQNFNLNLLPLGEIEILYWLQMLATYSGSLTIFASPDFATKLSLAARFHLEPMKKTSEALGIPVQKLVTPHCTARFITHKLFEGPVWGRMAIGVTLENLKYRYLEGRDNSFFSYSPEELHADYEETEWLSECGLQLSEVSKHGKLHNWGG